MRSPYITVDTQYKRICDFRILKNKIQSIDTNWMKINEMSKVFGAGNRQIEMFNFTEEL
jgi:hypothetical protein